MHTPHLTGSQDSTVRLWDLKRGMLHSSSRTHNNHAIRCVAAHDTMLASCAADGAVRVWHSLDLAQRPTMLPALHTGPVSCVALGRGSLVATGSWDSTVRLWRVAQEHQGGQHDGVSCMSTLGCSDWVSQVLLRGNRAHIRAGTCKQKKTLWWVATSFLLQPTHPNYHIPRERGLHRRCGNQYTSVHHHLAHSLYCHASHLEQQHPLHCSRLHHHRTRPARTILWGQTRSTPRVHHGHVAGTRVSMAGSRGRTRERVHDRHTQRRGAVGVLVRGWGHGARGRVRWVAGGGGAGHECGAHVAGAATEHAAAAAGAPLWGGHGGEAQPAAGGCGARVMWVFGGLLHEMVQNCNKTATWSGLLFA